MVIKPISNIFKSKFLIATVLFTLFFLTTCTPPEEFPTTPEITFNSIEFKSIPGSTSFADTLTITIDFKDGDGDLGLQTSTVNGNFFSSEVFFPYHDFEVISGSDGKLVTKSSESTSFPWVSTFPNASGTIFFSDTDQRPEFSCVHYQEGFINAERSFFTTDERALIDGNETQLKFYTTLPNQEAINAVNLLLLEKDTVLINKNKRHFNFLVDFYLQNGNGDFELFDWLTAFDETGCGGEELNGRFPVLDAASIGSSLEGTLSYSMSSFGFSRRLRNEVMKLEVRIIDRSGNVSNTIAIGGPNGFTLQEISSE